ncbi:hypothetical protein [Roseicella frigidaeris]|uniref:Uncharacterized protein n=1 Tax=Roseicella frigidaeris TaxID=2230885 RepID=A0A327MAX9_9PROT|nr:hypothetical protein [Roseicella frigidaeris]RAI59502.1 hypothetical protein DOO78_07830 [Roseicella frigidaeris]
MHPRRPTRHAQARRPHRRRPLALPSQPAVAPRPEGWAHWVRRCRDWLTRHWQRLRAEIRDVPFGEPW